MKIPSPGENATFLVRERKEKPRKKNDEATSFRPRGPKKKFIWIFLLCRKIFINALPRHKFKQTERTRDS